MPSTQPGGGGKTAPLAQYDVNTLEQLWVAEGGDPSKAQFAASVGMVESGGIPNKLSATGDVGLWQINVVHGAMASTDPVVNAQAAITISKNGTDWRPWCSCWSSNVCGVGTYLGSGSNAVGFYTDLAGNAVASSTINSFQHLGSIPDAVAGETATTGAVVGTAKAVSGGLSGFLGNFSLGNLLKLLFAVLLAGFGFYLMFHSQINRAAGKAGEAAVLA